MRRSWPLVGEVELVARRERAAVVATLARETRDIGLAEDAVQEALLAALESWPQRGVPNRPGAWLTVVARRAAWAAGRRRGVLLDDVQLVAIVDEAACDDTGTRLVDPQLELLFACCHPTLAVEAQVALTLRTVAGLTTVEVARAFLVSESTLAQRLTRAQRKIRDSGVRFELPPGLQDRGLPFTGGGLFSVKTATSLRRKDGQLVHTDGPFAETKEQLWGYYDLEAPDLETVIDAVSVLWELDHGTVEIRPVFPSPEH